MYLKHNESRKDRFERESKEKSSIPIPRKVYIALSDDNDSRYFFKYKKNIRLSKRVIYHKILRY